MKSKCLRSFWDNFQELPDSIQKLAVKSYTLWKDNPSHPSLKFKPIGDGVWSIRIGIHYRALGCPENGEIVWFWIGHHSEYDHII